jgi:hypothetical protein
MHCVQARIRVHESKLEGILWMWRIIHNIGTPYPALTLPEPALVLFCLPAKVTVSKMTACKKSDSAQHH